MNYMKQYDFLIVGSGLFGSVFTHKAIQSGRSCLVIDKRPHIGGNIYCEKIEDIHVHSYGAHIFHTSDVEIWDFVNQFVSFNHFVNNPIANYKGELYNLPFNMNTFYQLWRTRTPQEARKKIEQQRGEYSSIEVRNLEEQALKLVGKDIYEKLIKGYTEKQWGCSAKKLPDFIIKRLPFRFTFNNNYFNDIYQGIPIGGYNQLIDRLLSGSDVLLNTDFFTNRIELRKKAKTVVYTGMIDAYFDFCYGNLEYRSLRFETEVLKTNDFQGNAVVNYTDSETPFTRIIEHKHFEFGNQPNTVITREYPQQWNKTREAYYPINNERNELIFEKYKAIAQQESNVIFGGRLADYKYYDMDKVIRLALDKANLILNNK